MQLKNCFISLLFTTILFTTSCNRIFPDSEKKIVAEVSGNFLYEDDLQQIIPTSHHQDSAELADKYIRKWATDILMYEKAKQNISDMSEIDRLVNEYRKTLTIHQYQQGLVEKQKQKTPTEAEVSTFYNEYSSQMIMKENMIKGLLLVVPEDAPHIKDVRSWVTKADQEAIENIDKYSLQNAISYDYFMETWVPLVSIASKTPFEIKNPTQFLSTNQMAETSDSTHHYFLKISSYITVGQIEPYDLAHDKIVNILSTRNNAQFILEIESQLFNDAIANKTIKLYK